MSKDRDEALQEIYRRGNRLRWRFRAQLASIGVVAALATAGVVAAGHHDGTAHRTVEAGGRSPSSHVLADSTSFSGGASSSSTGGDDRTSSGHDTTPSTAKGKHSSSSTTTTVGPHGAAATGATSTTVACHNSTDPKCGPFHYDPPLPPNRPTKITIASDHTPVVGQPVTFTVTVDDPDGQGPGRCGQFDPGFTQEEQATTTTVAAPASASSCFETASTDPAAAHGYGAWDPPSTVPGHVVLTYTETYEQPVSHTVSYSTFDVGNCGDRSCPERTGSFTFSVAPTPPTTSSSARSG